MLKLSSKFNNKKRYHYPLDQDNDQDNDQYNEHEHEHEEYQYLNLLHDILQHGVMEKGRNGNTKSVFGSSMYFSLENGKIPILTSKKTAWKTCLKELLWFIRGDTNNEHLQREGVHIWDGNGSREFLDSRGLVDRAEGDLGPVYGFQWRHFNAPYADCVSDYAGQGVDQLARIIADLKNPETRSSRRHILSAWNPCQLDEMALPPCHMICPFHVRQGKYLSCALFQRSGDVGLGVPFNIASYSMLTHLLAAHCGLIAEEFVHFIGNCHIYEEHVFALKTQLEREPMDFPKIRIANAHDSIEDYTMDDIEWTSQYKSHGPIKMKMSA